MFLNKIQIKLGQLRQSILAGLQVTKNFLRCGPSLQYKFRII